jgi:hypothetical protein
MLPFGMVDHAFTGSQNEEGKYLGTLTVDPFN